MTGEGDKADREDRLRAEVARLRERISRLEAKRPDVDATELRRLRLAAEQTDEDWLRVLGVGAQVGGTVYLLKFGRDQELQADQLGVRYMSRLGYNPVAQLQVMEVLQSASAGGSRAMEFLSTHPLPQTRIDRLEKLIRKKYPDHDDPAAYRFHFDRYHKMVLDQLAELPPPRHRAANQGQPK